MREIKFRIYDVINKEMVYFTFDDIEKGKVWNRGYSWRLEKVEVMLCTVIKDKNGKESYEEDIILWNKQNWVLRWNKRMCQYYLQEIKSMNRKPDRGEWYFMRERMEKYSEIIGNRFENPELLEKK